MAGIDYQELICDHDRIDMLAQRLERIVARDLADVDSAERLLRELAEVVAAHLCKEDSFVYPGFIGCTDPAGASALVIEFETLKADWQTYLDTWQRGITQRDGERFRHDTVGMLARLRERVMKETSLLYGMALREGLISLRPMPR